MPMFPRDQNNMQLPMYRRITEEDLSDAPKGNWKSKLLYAINLFFQQMYSGLQNQLTPEQNDICQVKTFALTGSATAAKNVYNFTTLFPYQPSRVTLGKIVPTDGSSLVFTTAPFLSWSFANGTFNVLGICGLTDTVPYSITIEIRWAPIVN
jgi:hypothetical protein